MNPVRNTFTGLGLLIALYHPMALAQPSVPQAGLAAEMAGRWDEAITIYHRTLATEPGRADLWRRVADIQASQGRKPEALAALRKAVAADPDNAANWYQLSLAYAGLNQPRQALDACQHAHQLQPDNLDYLKTCARQASWADELDTAHDLYQAWLERHPDDADAQLGLARVDGWAGRLNASADAYQRYLAAHPENAVATLEYVQVEIWRGDYGKAKDVLDDYQARFGEDERYLGLLARLLARAEWPDAATAVYRPLLAAHPRDYGLNYTRTLTLRAGNRPAQAIDSLAVLQALRPDSRDTADVNRFVRTPTRSHVRGSVSYYDDSDEISILRLGADGRYVLDNKRTALMVGYDHERLRVRAGSGLDTIDGRSRIHFQELWLGVEHRFSPRVLGGARLGVADVQRKARIATHQLYLELDPADKLALRLAHKRALYDLSPRAVSLGIVQNGNLLSAHWRPDLRWFIDGQAGWSEFSDDNQKWQLVLAPRRAVVRHEHFNLDLGVSGEWFGFDRNLNNGYYDPEYYRRYAMTAFSYWKIDDDNGISAALSLGWHKDETMPSYKFGEDVVVEGFFGIYRDWYLRAHAGYAERYQNAGSYDGLSLSAALMRRF
jgi:tetratricopeptide (TPR) repeat protein